MGVLYFIKDLLIYLRERVHACELGLGERQREKERENPPADSLLSTKPDFWVLGGWGWGWRETEPQAGSLLSTQPKTLGA